MQLDDNDDFNDDDDVNFSHEWFPLFIHILDKRVSFNFIALILRINQAPLPPPPYPPPGVTLWLLTLKINHRWCHFFSPSVHGRFLSWSKWHTCSRSCGTRGLSVRTRSCTEPRYGGQSCFGTSVETRPCNRKHCPGKDVWIYNYCYGFSFIFIVLLVLRL